MMGQKRGNEEELQIVNKWITRQNWLYRKLNVKELEIKKEILR